ncbi:hypothetical protein JCM8115_004531 [Rhodotorula mucilaginosa]
MQHGANYGRGGAGGSGSRRGGRTSRGGSTGALRTSAGHGAARTQPYGRPSASTSTSTSNASDGKWQHDLFGQDSDLYNPSINFSSFSKRVPGWDEVSPSLRPFGPNTPAAQALIVTPTGQVTSYNPNAQLATAQVPTGPAIGIKGTNAAAANSVRKQQQRDRAELVRQRKELEKQRQETVKIAKEEELGFVVEVAGLVAGTSAEDVQTAFGAYGEIRFCFIVDPKASDLVARLTFTRHDDAAAACSKLDGAIADGRPLRVKQATRTPMPPPLPPMPKVASSASTPMLDLTGSPTPVVVAQPAVVAPPAPRSKMYADKIEAAQAQAFVAVAAPVVASMDIDMIDDQVTATAAAAARTTRVNGVNGGRPGAPVVYLPGAQPVNPLAARLGPSLVSGGSTQSANNRFDRRGGNGVPAHAPRQPAAAAAAASQAGAKASLMARLGVTTAPGRGQNGAAAAGAGGRTAGMGPAGGWQQQRGPRAAGQNGGAAALLSRIG